VAHEAAKGCAAVAGLLVAIVVAVPLGWAMYDAIRPRDPLEVLFQQVIRSALISDSYRSTTGWDEADVSAEICGKVDANALGKLAISPEYRIASPFPLGDQHLLPADVWEFAENKNIFDRCSDHSFRVLSIELQESSGQCRAFVQPRPTCDP
jgi:hypothetical protein